MTVVDYVVLAGLALSMVAGFWRGVVSEILALAAWVLVVVLGKSFAPYLAPELAQWISNPTLRYLAAFAAIAVVVLLLCSLVRLLLRNLLRVVGLGLIDRFLGAIFGLARGMLVLLVLVVAGGMTSFPKQPWWRDSAVLPPAETTVVAMKPWLPADWASKIRYR